VVTLLAHGCPLQAIVVACGVEERTVADGVRRAGVQGQAVQEPRVEQPRALRQGHADASRVKQQGGIVWMALAMMVSTRLWLAGAVSEQRDMPRLRRLLERLRAGALRRPLLCWTAGWCSSMRAMRETFRAPVQTGSQGRPRWRPWRHVCMAPVVKRSAQRRVVDGERRIVAGTPARVETLRRRAQGAGVIHTASIERLNATFRARLASLPRRGRALARRTLTLQHGMSLIGTVYTFCPPHASLRLPGLTAGTAGIARTPRWPRGSRIMAGPSEHCWRFLCHHCVGPHPSTVDVHRLH
jgi:hypothetical protein